MEGALRGDPDLAEKEKIDKIKNIFLNILLNLIILIFYLKNFLYYKEIIK